MSKETHYIPPFTRINGPFQETVCGTWIRPSEHSNEPKCKRCQQWFDAIADMGTAEEAIGTEPQNER